ncbi:hypothetical protein ACFL2Q_00570 [Thermodesulfobacteriota bacterium]
MGHSSRNKTVAERYGRRISDDELLGAIDMMTFDHGPTEIVVTGRRGKRDSENNVNWALTNGLRKE